MPAIANALFVATALLYLAASVLFIGDLAGVGRAGGASGGVTGTFARAARFAPLLVAIGVPCHAAQIVVWSLVLRVCPVEGIHFALSVASMLACLAYVLGRLRFRMDAVGAFVAPQALAFLLASRFVGPAVDGEPRLRSALLPFHVASSLFGIALFTLASASAVAYLLQERHLKRKQLEGADRLPPIDALDRAEHQFLVAGFPLLTIGILTGTIWAREVQAGGAADVARAALSYAAWALIAGVLLLRAAAGWRGRRAAVGTILGFGLTMLVLFFYLMRSVIASGRHA
jgi:ABC-type uncharacterized transport system permease subunit